MILKDVICNGECESFVLYYTGIFVENRGLMAVTYIHINRLYVRDCGEVYLKSVVFND